MEFVQPIWDREQVVAIKKILRSGSLRSYVLFVLEINSGLRVSDLLNLTLGDVAETKSKIRERISLREEKTGKYKDFPLSENAKKVLQEYLRTREYLLQRRPIAQEGEF